MTTQSQSFGTLSVARHFGTLVWFEPNNTRRDYGDTNEINTLRNSLATYGWVTDNPVPGVESKESYGHLTEAQLATELKRRGDEWLRLKEIAKINATAQTEAELKVFEFLYCEGEGDERKLIVPTVSMNAGFRRARNYRASQVQRYVDTKSATDKDVRTMIPVRITVYTREVDRLIDQQLENEMQGVGQKKMDDLEKLITTKLLYDQMAKEVDIRRLYSSSTGQKTYGICRTNDNWPSLDFYERFLIIDQNDPRRIPWGPIRGDQLVKFNNRFEADRKRKEQLPLSKDEMALEPITIADMENYIAERIGSAGSGKNAIKQMSKPDMEAMKGGHKLKLVRSALDSVLGNTQLNLKPLVDHADAMNGIFDLVKGGPETAAIADKVVLATLSHGTIMADVAELLQAGKADLLVKAIADIKAAPVPTAPAPEAPEVKAETPAPEVKAEAAPAAASTTPPPDKKKRSR